MLPWDLQATILARDAAIDAVHERVWYRTFENCLITAEKAPGTQPATFRESFIAIKVMGKSKGDRKCITWKKKYANTGGSRGVECSNNGSLYDIIHANNSKLYWDTLFNLDTLWKWWSCCLSIDDIVNHTDQNTDILIQKWWLSFQAHHLEHDLASNFP